MKRSRGGGARRTLLSLSLALAFVVVRPGFVSAQSSEDPAVTTGGEGALFLLLPVGARAVSLGRVATALESAESGFWNPAGLAGVENDQVVLFRGDHVAGTATAVSAVWASPRVGTLAASYFLLDAGELDQRDENGNFTGTITIRSHLAGLSAGTRLSGWMNAGVTLKMVQFRLSCRGICPDAGTSATTWAVDAGVQTRLPSGVRLGAMVAHVGPRLQVRNAEQADPLPARLRLAATYDVVRALTDREALSGWIGVEVQDRLHDPGTLSVYFGSELTTGRSDAISLRAGYVVSELDQEDGTRVGIGLRYQRFDLSIAKSLAVSSLTGETEPVHVTFAIAL